MPRDTGERAVKLFGHSALGWGAHIREFLRRPEAAAMRLVCAKLCETVDGRWTFPWVRGSKGVMMVMVVMMVIFGGRGWSCRKQVEGVMMGVCVTGVDRWSVGFPRHISSGTR